MEKNKVKFRARKSFQNLRVHYGILIDEMKNILACITVEQKAVFQELKRYMLNTKFGANGNFFREGILTYIESLYGLHDYMKTKFNLPYLLTSHVENDHHERFIGVIRQFDGKGGNRRPSALALTYRISR